MGGHRRKKLGKVFRPLWLDVRKGRKLRPLLPGILGFIPAFNGAIAATYESNGGGSKGFKWERPDGTVVTLREAVHKHFIADMATLEVLADNREAILKDFYGFFKSGMDEVGSEPFKTFVLDNRNDPERTGDLVELLLRHGIEVYKSGRAVSSRRSQTYFDRQFKSRSFAAGSYFVPMRQPKKRFLKTMLEPDQKWKNPLWSLCANDVPVTESLGRRLQKKGRVFTTLRLGLYRFTTMSTQPLLKKRYPFQT